MDSLCAYKHLVLKFGYFVRECNSYLSGHVHILRSNRNDWNYPSHRCVRHDQRIRQPGRNGAALG